MSRESGRGGILKTGSRRSLTGMPDAKKPSEMEALTGDWMIRLMTKKVAAVRNRMGINVGTLG